jgi:DNA topoisomerase IA
MVAKVILSQIQGEVEAEVISVDKSLQKQARPIGLNTVKLLKVASKTFGMSSSDTMHMAE